MAGWLVGNLGSPRLMRVALDNKGVGGACAIVGAMVTMACYAIRMFAYAALPKVGVVWAVLPVEPQQHPSVWMLPRNGAHAPLKSRISATQLHHCRVSGMLVPFCARWGCMARPSVTPALYCAPGPCVPLIID
eukprot:943070-Pelagomonas_calceolata.AAC.6